MFRNAILCSLIKMKCPFQAICSKFDWKSPLCTTGVGKSGKVVSAKTCFDKHEFKNKAILGHCYVCSKTTIYWMESVAQQERVERKLFTSQSWKKTNSSKCCSLSEDMILFLDLAQWHRNSMIGKYMSYQPDLEYFHPFINVFLLFISRENNKQDG